MPDLIRHPEVIVFTGFSDKSENDVLMRFSIFYETIIIVFPQYPVVQSEFETMNLANCRIYFSHRGHGEYREEICDYFLNLWLCEI